MTCCRKSGDVVETILKPQWWVNCKPMAEEALKASHQCNLDIDLS